MLGSRERKPPSYIYDMKYKYLSCDSSLVIHFFFYIHIFIDSFFIFNFKIKQEIKLVRVKLVKKARFYAINKAIAIQLVL
jgi:hypothetical protein